MSSPFPQLIEESTFNREFYARPAIEVARDCLGKILVDGKTTGRIVKKVEAYLAIHYSEGLAERARIWLWIVCNVMRARYGLS